MRFFSYNCRIPIHVLISYLQVGMTYMSHSIMHQFVLLVSSNRVHVEKRQTEFMTRTPIDDDDEGLSTSRIRKAREHLASICYFAYMNGTAQ